jgi:Skp family chaperone for outer membrane proteins
LCYLIYEYYQAIEEKRSLENTLALRQREIQDLRAELDSVKQALKARKESLKREKNLVTIHLCQICIFMDLDIKRKRLFW